MYNLLLSQSYTKKKKWLTCYAFWCFRFNDDPGAEKKMLPQYDDPIADEVWFLVFFPFIKKSLSNCSSFFIQIITRNVVYGDWSWNCVVNLFFFSGVGFRWKRTFLWRSREKTPRGNLSSSKKKNKKKRYGRRMVVFEDEELPAQ